MRTFVIGDIHGEYKSLLECLELSKFNKNADRLICLGDVCDRGGQVKECIDELLTIPQCIYILGNHDAWAMEWAIHGTGIIEKSKISEIESIKKTIFDPEDKHSIWVKVSSTKVRLDGGVNLKEDSFNGIPEDDFERIWDIVRQALPKGIRMFYLKENSFSGISKNDFKKLWLIMQQAIPLKEWWDEGGSETVMSYKEVGMPKEHIEFLSQAPRYFVDKNRLFVHGGYDWKSSLEETPNEILIWDRSLIQTAYLLEEIYKGTSNLGVYDEIYVGHTPTFTLNGKLEPQKFCNVWDMDTGAGWGKRLTIMDVDTKEFWQSRNEV